ncbi:G0/G1 switch protein 2 [Kryptolebias marmoratus]|uniref:G0/G1 switch protein 2 n=1 Tax=Kryptolebias marmoratus TaxID=37003 RepID=UPI0007F86B0F|nr:G0/G1 switch protein 2 [Kryptolebias marmoratus]
MESMQELIPFAKELLSQKPTRNLLKVYMLGSVFAVLGTAIGLVETLFHPFSSGEPLDAEMFLLMAREQREAEAQTNLGAEGEEEEREEELAQESKAKTHNCVPTKTHKLSQRSPANRLHAS